MNTHLHPADDAPVRGAPPAGAAAKSRGAGALTAGGAPAAGRPCGTAREVRMMPGDRPCSGRHQDARLAAPRRLSRRPISILVCSLLRTPPQNSLLENTA